MTPLAAPLVRALAGRCLDVLVRTCLEAILVPGAAPNDEPTRRALSELTPAGQDVCVLLAGCLGAPPQLAPEQWEVLRRSMGQAMALAEGGAGTLGLRVAGQAAAGVGAGAGQQQQQPAEEARRLSVAAAWCLVDLAGSLGREGGLGGAVRCGMGPWSGLRRVLHKAMQTKSDDRQGCG